MPPSASQIRRAKANAVGGSPKRCQKGKSCSATCIAGNETCLVELPEPTSEATGKVRNFLRNKSQSQPVVEEADYTTWKPVAEGNYGKVSISPDGTRAVKELLVGSDGKAGEFGEYEVELAKRMGELGHSPRIYRATDKALEMDVAPGKPLWEGYSRGENEPVMNTAQATKAASAIRDLHKMGYFHGDMHSQQFLVDGDNIKLVDYGLSRPISTQPVRVMQDLAKIAKLVDWENPELQGNPYVQLVNKYLPVYRGIKGTSQKAKRDKQGIAEDYLAELEQLQ